MGELLKFVTSDGVLEKKRFWKKKEKNFGSDPAGVQLYLNHQLELNSNLKAIVNMSSTNVVPALYAKLLQCQATSCSVERSFSMLGKLLAKDRQFAQGNVWKYLALYVNKTSAE